MKLHLYCIIILFLSCPFALLSQEGEHRDLIGEDGVLINKHNEHRFSRLLYDILTVSPSSASDETAAQDYQYLERFAGRTIRDIIVLNNPVADPDSRLWLDRTMNKLHVTTRDEVIRKDILFASGEEFDPDLMMNNRQLIRSRKYISDVDIRVQPSPQDSMVVDVYVITRDTWTISADGHIYGDGETELKIFDNNIGGWGNRLSVTTSLNWRDPSYGGNMVEYDMPNMLGTFFSGRVVAGKSFDRYMYGVSLNKDFIVPSDHAGGMSLMKSKDTVKIFYEDTVITTGFDNFDIWGGKSILLPNIKSSIYFTTRFSYLKYTERPETTEILNPYFRNHNLLIGGVGLYRERFRSSTLIHGYGIKEDIAYGYKAELNGGYSWEEFGDRWYLGGSFGAGYFTNIGYLRWDVALGSYLNSADSKFYRTSLVTNLSYFTRLMSSGTAKVRHFANINLTRGWNRLEGYRETLGFVYDSYLRGMRANPYGQNRLVLRNETVVFTPWQIYGFKIALFGFLDCGLIGNNANFFKNEFNTTIGAGVRIKNESLVFSAISIRLGVALNKSGFVDADYFSASNNERVHYMRYIPGRPEPVDYR